jgi:hypothetical protein
MLRNVQLSDMGVIVLIILENVSSVFVVNYCYLFCCKVLKVQVSLLSLFL